MTFKPGDVVRLKSGGHDMTVAGMHLTGPWSHDGSDKVDCDWHSTVGESWRVTYREDQLQFIRNDETVAQQYKEEEKIKSNLSQWQGLAKAAKSDTFNRVEFTPAVPTAQEYGDQLTSSDGKQERHE